MEDRAIEVERVGSSAGMVVIRDAGRRYPGLLVQGDALLALLRDLEEEAPGSVALQTVTTWLDAYESVISVAGRELPYSPRA